MTYRELLQLYKTGKLDKTQEEQVAADIEKQDAISEYLYENTEVPGLDEFDNFHEEGDGEEAKFVSTIQGYIRKAFLKMGAIVAVAVLVIVLFTVFLVPGIVSSFYYDPGERVAIDATGEDPTNRMSLDLSVYSEVYLPGSFRNMVGVEKKGYGKYDITIPQVISYNGNFTTVNGVMERNKLTLYNSNILTPPTGNAFVLPNSVRGNTEQSRPGGDVTNIGAAGTKQESFNTVKSLDENQWYTAYVSLSKVTDYTSFYKWLNDKDISYGDLWCAVLMQDEEGNVIGKNMGFITSASGDLLDWDREKYPRLSLLGNEEEDNEDISENADALKTHFISLISYLRDNDQISDIMDGTSEYYDAMIKSVNKTGLQLYGFAIKAQKDTLVKLTKDSRVSYIYTAPLY